MWFKERFQDLAVGDIFKCPQDNANHRYKKTKAFNDALHYYGDNAYCIDLRLNCYVPVLAEVRKVGVDETKTN